MVRNCGGYHSKVLKQKLVQCGIVFRTDVFGPNPDYATQVSKGGFLSIELGAK